MSILLVLLVALATVFTVNADDSVCDCQKDDDTCYWLPDGDYKSRKLPDPMYITCKNGHMSTKTCHPNEAFNPWTSKCECKEVFCEKGDGFQPSVCKGCGYFLYCLQGFPLYVRVCPDNKPYWSERAGKCSKSCNSCYGGCSSFRKK